MYWNSVSTFGALLQIQYHSCEEIVYFSRDLVLLSFNISNIPKSQRTCSWSQHDAFIVQDSESINWNSVSTFEALLHFQYHSCEEIVYFSRDFSTTFIQYIQHTEVTANQLKSNRYFHCARLWIDVLKFSIHFWGTSSISVPQLWRDSLLFKGFQYYFHSIHPTYRSHGEPAEVNMMLSLCKTLNRCTEIQYPLLGTSSLSVPQLWRDSLLFKGF